MPLCSRGSSPIFVGVIIPLPVGVIVFNINIRNCEIEPNLHHSKKDVYDKNDLSLSLSLYACVYVYHVYVCVGMCKLFIASYF